jgi:single-strand DNA-binding protein
MASLNKVMLMGNIGNAPECRTMPNGDPVAHFRLATTEGWTDRSTHERKEHTEWHSIVCYRQQADFVREYLGKGRQIYVEGLLAHAQMDGQARHRTLQHGGARR